MRVLVLGTGLQGSACAFDLLHTTDAVVTLADSRAVTLPDFLDRASKERLVQIQLDARDEFAVAAAIEANDVVLSALPYYFNYDILRLAVAGGTHFADLGGNTEIVDRQLSLHDKARDDDTRAVVDCGLAPGMANVLARDLIDRLDEAETVRLYVGGLPQSPVPPLNYQVVYSLEGTFDYYTTKAWVLRDGAPQRVEALSELEDIEFPEPIGALEAFHTGGGLSTMPWDFEGKIRSMEYKTLRYPGHADYMRAIRALGLLGTDPVAVNGISVIPRDLFVQLADTALRTADGKDLVALLITAEGKRAGKPVRLSYRMVDLFDEEHGLSAMTRTTGYSLSITAQMLHEGLVDRGVYTAHQATPPAEYISRLGARGIRIELTEE